MKSILIKERDFIPGVILDKVNGRFEITGKACPENLDEFYDPIFRWLDEYTNDPNPETTFDIKLIYYNTASSKALLKIMQKLEILQNNGSEVKIRWHYELDDEELLIAGEDYAELIKVKFEFIQL
ncbi:MAG: DUF1987 domain-containing protein [Bacteroidales bacterium]|nr:DUF1987 domain-containing protein [Bacteroidales bacterium]